VGVLFGGRSAEHEVSLQSAKNIVEFLDKDKYEILLIGIDRHGNWHLNDDSKFLLDADNPSLIRLPENRQGVALLPGKGEAQILNLSERKAVGGVDVVFPALHGPYGEDGTIQGLLKLADLPFVGAGVTGSAIGMDKDVMKRLLRDAGIPLARFIVLHGKHKVNQSLEKSINELGFPLFVKPANLGSSVGISKVKEAKQLREAVELAFSYDTKVLIEETIEGIEIECSVLGNDNPIASLPGRVIPKGEFYSYEAKYIDENGAVLEIPADLDRKTIAKVQKLAVDAFQALCCEGMARVDFFITHRGEILVNEINTIPGFTQISMYPKLWEVSGISYPDLLDRLIDLALERHERDGYLKTTV
jgi:D-alanine-D-alanine ligase